MGIHRDNFSRIPWQVGWMFILAVMSVWPSAAYSQFADTNIAEVARLSSQVDQYYRQGKFPEALVVSEKELRFLEAAYGPDNIAIGNTLQTLATLYFKTGDFARTETSLQRALTIQQKNLGPDNPATLNTSASLGMLYLEMGDPAKALPLIEHAARVQEQAYGPDSPTLAKTLAKLSGLYSAIGNPGKAAGLAERVLSIDEKNLGAENLDTALAQLNLGIIYGQLGETTNAEPLLQAALRTQKKLLGPDHPDLASTVNALAGLYARSGDYAKAESFLLQVVRMDENSHSIDNQASAVHLDNVAVNYFDLHKTNQMLVFADKAEKVQLALLENILSFASEQQRLAYIARNDPYTLFASVNDAGRMAQAILRHKAVVLDSIVEDRALAFASQNPDDRELIDQLITTKQKLAQLSIFAPGNLTPAALKDQNDASAGFAQQVERLEGALAKNVQGIGHTRRALSCTVEQVQEKIPAGSALLEFVRYQQYLGHQQWESRYGAVLLACDTPPKWVSLGQADDIDNSTIKYQMAVRGREQISDSSFSNLLDHLYGKILTPLDALLPPGTTNLIISPDGLLNFISFATLLTPSGQFLAEKFDIQYVVSGRDLLRETTLSTNQNVVFFAAPDYAAGGQITLPRTGLQLVPLPFMAKSTFDLIDRIKSWNWPEQTFSRADATKANLYALHAPRILHFSTHGFLLPEDIPVPESPLPGNLLSRPKTPPSPVILRNPMYRNGIALAGAQVTIDAWKRGETRPTENDGILTADEASGLDLHGTWLVVLAACDSGVGGVRIGEGIMGLRRGFVQAGAQNLLLTLWPVFDVPSCEFMLEFYSSLHQNNSPARALSEAQRAALRQYRTQYGLLRAVGFVGAFILNSQGA